MKEIKKQLVYQGFDVVIYEDGWWMKRKEFKKLQENRLAYGIDRNKKTHELTIYYLPPQVERKEKDE